jgi:large subunit ribosomal protein L22
MSVPDTSAEVRAEAKYVRRAPRKAQLVVSEIRGLRVADATTVLAFMPRAAARDVEAVLASAVANAEANHGLSGDDLYVSAAYVGSGPTLKRWRARARGRVGRIKKRTCHITIRLAPLESAAELAAPIPKAAGEPRSAPRRGARPEKAETPAPASVASAEAAPATEEAAPGEEKPKRTPRKKAEPALPSEPAAEAAPKPRRPRATREAAEAAPKAAEEKPRRPPRKKAVETEPKEEES